MADNKTGVWIIGARGSISVTVMVGALAMKKRLADRTGMVTEDEAFSGLNLPALENLEFGGCDIRSTSLLTTAEEMRNIPGVDSTLIDKVAVDLSAIEPYITKGTARNCGEAISRLADSPGTRPSLLEEIETIRHSLRSFKEKKGLDNLVVVNLASTEPPLPLEKCHENPDFFAERLQANDEKMVRASTLYAYSAIAENCPYINFTPSSGALIPALIKFAEKQGVPVMGNDGKTGETLVKSALAPMFLARNLEVLSWEGFNILGNMDGQILDHPGNCQSKLKTKDQVLQHILGYAPHSRVRIDYVPSLGDQKTAWDFIHFQGFLGGKMTLQFTWQGYDSLLAAPLILDLVRLASFAGLRGECGLMPHLSSFFKAPLGVDEHRLGAQYDMLLNYVRDVMSG